MAIKKYLSVFLFILLNLLLSTDIILEYAINGALILPVFVFADFIDGGEIGLLCWSIPFVVVIYLFYLLLKISVLQIIYEFINKSDFVFLFLDKVKNNIILQLVVLLIVLVIDININSILKLDNHWHIWNIIFPGKLFLCYLSFFIWKKNSHKENPQYELIKTIKKLIKSILIIFTVLILFFILLFLAGYFFFRS